MSGVLAIGRRAAETSRPLVANRRLLMVLVAAFAVFFGWAISRGLMSSRPPPAVHTQG